MTENEAIARFKSCQENVGKCEKCRFYSCCSIYDMEDTAIKALEEVQQYRALGTPEELRSMKEHGGFTGVELAQIAAGRMKLKEYQTIGTPEECRAAREKQIPKRPKEYEDKYYGCPTCRNVLLHKWEKYPDKLMDKRNGLPYCLGCGQKLNWEDEE